jgi:hypothetical protein
VSQRGCFGFIQICYLVNRMYRKLDCCHRILKSS